MEDQNPRTKVKSLESKIVPKNDVLNTLRDLYKENHITNEDVVKAKEDAVFQISIKRTILQTKICPKRKRMLCFNFQELMALGKKRNLCKTPRTVTITLRDRP